MSILYTCIARQDTVLAHQGKDDRQKKQFFGSLKEILASFGAQDNMRASKQQNNMFFYVLIQNGVTFLTFTESNVQKGAAYGMLSEIANQFSSRYQPSAYKFAQELSMDGEMRDILNQNMKNIVKFSSKTNELQSNLDEVKGLVMDNIAKVMERAQNLDQIADSALQLRDNAEDFVVSTNKVKNQMLKKKIMMIVGIVIAVIVVILVIVLPFVI
ncbi:Synaptobrevin [Spironucleus salmonicida]|uniref:Synaptobrevin n=1 Tax=Spironucleus salmonicida TaxID=348837 RepID=V6LTB6_9EUKA|nr:Synaptobrevin [Spironucleus salmonicida]|eukprot:EST47498.1 Synaptobrevin [Spironucleus salmonicida]